MSFLDMLSWIADDISTSIELMAEEFPSFQQDMRDIKNDFQEITTDGVKEIVIKGNDNYKTSSELRDEANSIIHNASQKLNDTLEKTKAMIVSLNNNNEKLQKKRICLLGSYKDPEISINDLRESKFATPIKKPEYHWDPNDEYIFGGIRALPEPLARSERVMEAKKFHEQAQDYSVQVDAELARLHSIQTQVLVIENAIKEENQVLDILGSLCFQVPKNEKPDIILRIETILQENLFSDTNERSAAYQRALSDLKHICQKYK